MNTVAIILIVTLVVLAVIDSIITAALWVNHKIDKEEIEEYEKRL